jgi:hypothetical protein
MPGRMAPLRYARLVQRDRRSVLVVLAWADGVEFSLLRLVAGDVGTDPKPARPRLGDQTVENGPVARRVRTTSDSPSLFSFANHASSDSFCLQRAAMTPKSSPHPPVWRTRANNKLSRASIAPNRRRCGHAAATSGCWFNTSSRTVERSTKRVTTARIHRSEQAITTGGTEAG